MNTDLFRPTGLDGALAALERDLTAPGGPSISTMRNHNFALLVYPPDKEFPLRQGIHRMVSRLEGEGWAVLSVALHQVLLTRLRAELGPDALQALIERERRLHARDKARALATVRDQLNHLLDGPDGLAAEIERRIQAFLKDHPTDPDRTLVLLGRAGALYPFYRSSALLKHLGGRTGKLPVVLLYPGKKQGEEGLSFMEELAPDRDYRPRIYV